MSQAGCHLLRNRKFLIRKLDFKSSLVDEEVTRLINAAGENVTSRETENRR